MNTCARLKNAMFDLVSASDGTAAMEFALILPVLVTVGMYGTELAYMATVRTQISEVASSVADNASRLGQTDNSSVTPTVSEADIDSIMFGAIKQGSPVDLERHGRIVLSSLEKEPFTGKQYIHWQRCAGELDRKSAYGDDQDKNGLNGSTLAGMGPAGHTITAATGNAVMFVEVYYRYDGLFGDMFVDGVEFRQEAAFQIRDDRNLTPGVTGAGGQSACA